MNRVWITLCLAGLVGCVGSETDDQQGEVSSAVTRPPLSSICSSTCRNSHSQLSCSDQRNSGQVNVSALPLLEGASFVAVPGITTAGWSSTSCPNCQWSLVSVTDDNANPVTSGVLIASAAVNVSRTSGSSFDKVSIQISDPTDASVGVCNLNVWISLTIGLPQ